MTRMPTLIAAALLMVSAMPGAAAPGDPQRREDPREQAGQRPAPSSPQRQERPSRQGGPSRPAASAPQQDRGDRDYGRWDNRWGQRPPAPPRHWTRTNDWHRHVRACQLRYRSYSARTDTFLANSGQRQRCRL